MRVLWFGTRGYERWIKMPRVNQSRGQYGSSDRSDHLGGGVTISGSTAGHMEYVMEWNAITTEQTQQIRDFLDGLYNTDENRGLLYFTEPSAKDVNAFSKVWAAPYLAGIDAPSLTKGVRPALVSTGANSLRLPPRSAVFTVTADTVRSSFYVPIPPGHTAHFAFYGPTEQVDKIIAIPYAGETAGTPTEHTIQPNADYGTGLESVDADGVEFALTDAVGSITLTAAILQILPTGDSPASITEYLSGRGHSGCEVDGDIEQVLANAKIDRELLAVKLVETGAWL